MSTRLPNQGAFQLIRTLIQTAPGVKILVLGIAEAKERVLQYIEAGATGYVLKENSLEDLLTAIRAAQAGKALVSPEIAAALIAFREGLEAALAAGHRLENARQSLPPVLEDAIEHGADIVVNSLTKWMGGHGTAIGGIVVDSGKFDWQDPKFKLYNEPDASYHGIRYAHDLGDMNPIAFALRMRLVPLRNLGACISPDNAWMFLQGLETLPLRMQRHCENAIEVARFLKEHAKVEWVRYPGLEDDPAYPVASKYLKKGFGGMVVFGIKGGLKAGQKFVDSLKLFSLLANVGDAKSLVIHPASTTHSQLTEEQQKAGGLTPDLVRLSIGLEHIDDIKQDLEQAFAQT